MSKKVIEVGFVIPIIDGKLFLGKRGTEPQKGKWGAVGGKLENLNLTSAIYSKLFKRKSLHLDGNVYEKNSEIDRVAKNQESILAGALRETAEELFSDDEKNFSESDLKNLFINPVYLGMLKDKYMGKNILSYFYIVTLNSKLSNLNLSSREIPEFERFSDIEFSKIWPMTQLALFQLYKSLSDNVGFGIPDSSGNFKHYFNYKNDLIKQFPKLSLVDLPEINSENGNMHYISLAILARLHGGEFIKDLE